PHHTLHSFPTRRSSDLDSLSSPHIMERGTKRNEVQLSFVPWQNDFAFAFCRVPFARLDEFQTGGKNRQTSRSSSQLSVRRVKARSEEHTSELQSRGHLV